MFPLVGTLLLLLPGHSPVDLEGGATPLHTHRLTDRQTERPADIQTERETGRQTDQETERQIDQDREAERERETNRQREVERERQRERERERASDEQKGKRKKFFKIIGAEDDEDSIDDEKYNEEWKPTTDGHSIPSGPAVR